MGEVIRKPTSGEWNYGGNLLNKTPSSAYGYNAPPQPSAGQISYPVGGGGTARAQTPPEYTYSGMRYDSSPTQDSILKAGGTIGRKQSGTDFYGNPTWETSYQLPLQGYGNPTTMQQAALDHLKKLQDQYTSVASSVSSGSGGGGGYTPTSFSFSPQQAPPRVQFPNAAVSQAGNAANAAQNAAMAKGKAQAGSLGKSAVDSLRANLAERGILGGGTEARGLVDRLAAATNPLSDLNVAGLQENVGIAQHEFDINNQNALASYQGEIGQRGQDIGLQGQQFNQALAQAQFDAQQNQFGASLAQRQREQQQQTYQQALAGLNRLY